MAILNTKIKQINEKLIAIRRTEEENAAKETAEKLNLPYVNLTITPIDYEDLAIIPRQDAEQGNILVIQRNNRILRLAAKDPKDPKTDKIIKELENKGFECKIFIASLTSLRKGWGYYDIVEKHSKKSSLRSVFIIQKKELDEFKESLQTVQELKKTINILPTSRLLTIILAGAIEMRASDIHIEPTKENIRLRYRIDGLLQDIVEFPISQYSFLLSKIKMLSDLLLNVHDISQDGRFSINILEDEKIEQTIDLRISILPSSQGESIVMRLLGLSFIKLNIESLGIRADLFKIIKNQISQPTGAILTTGPTGSGKTTTLYACLNYVNKPGRKIITVENPVEYQLKGITQTQISRRKGHTFGTALRSIVRQDPDILMIGEIRDEESAEIAIQFSLTGHLVFSTLHTNDAAGAIPRLNGMGINSPALASAINLIIAQRLVRQLCPYCKKPYQPPKEEIEAIKKIFSNISKKSGADIPKKIDHLYKAEGCSKCYGLGYNGRVGVFELFTLSNEIKKVILERGASYELQAKAKEQGMTTLMEDALLKAVSGETTMEEIRRVIGSPELTVEELLSKQEVKKVVMASPEQKNQEGLDKGKKIRIQEETEGIKAIKERIKRKKIEARKQEEENERKGNEERKKIREQEEMKKQARKQEEESKREKEEDKKAGIIKELTERNERKKKEAEEERKREEEKKKEKEEKEAEEKKKKQEEERKKQENN